MILSKALDFVSLMNARQHIRRIQMVSESHIFMISNQSSGGSISSAEVGISS